MVGAGYDPWGAVLLENHPLMAIRAARQPSLMAGRGIEAHCRYQLGRRIRIAHQATQSNIAATPEPSQGAAPYRRLPGLSGKPGLSFKD